MSSDTKFSRPRDNCSRTGDNALDRHSIPLSTGSAVRKSTRKHLEGYYGDTNLLPPGKSGNSRVFGAVSWQKIRLRYVSDHAGRNRNQPGAIRTGNTAYDCLGN